MGFEGHGKVSKPDSSTKAGWLGYTCGHCNHKVSGAVVAFYGWISKSPSIMPDVKHTVFWLQCTCCGHGSVRDDGNCYPGLHYGPIIDGLPSEIENAYSEVRRCMSVNSYTASELLCRKILMHVAVEKGAKEGESFDSYLTYLEKTGYITPPIKNWVDSIRKHGNESTHKIDSPDKERAECTVMFTAELLKLIYEMDHLAKIYTPKEKTTN